MWSSLPRYRANLRTMMVAHSRWCPEQHLPSQEARPTPSVVCLCPTADVNWEKRRSLTLHCIIYTKTRSNTANFGQTCLPKEPHPLSRGDGKPYGTTARNRKTPDSESPPCPDEISEQPIGEIGRQPGTIKLISLQARYASFGERKAAGESAGPAFGTGFSNRESFAKISALRKSGHHSPLLR